MKNSPLAARRSHSFLGFTLMELLVAVSIIGILVSIGIVSYATVNKRSRDTKRKSDIEQLRSAMEMYRIEIGSYPSGGCVGQSCSFVDVSTLLSDLVSDYIPAIPTDPKAGEAYRYKATNTSGGNYYGYCLSARLEAGDPADTCTPDTGYNHNMGVKNP